MKITRKLLVGLLILGSLVSSPTHAKKLKKKKCNCQVVQSSDPNSIKARSAIVIDQETNKVIFSKNPSAVLPIASLTKLMTATIVLDANQPLDEILEVTTADIDTVKHTSSRLPIGTRLTREEFLHLALMSSENRAANTLGRNYPGGLKAAVAAMNDKARTLGMRSTHYVEPTGLSKNNTSNANDLVLLVKYSSSLALIRELSTSTAYEVEVNGRTLAYRSTNKLTSDPLWDLGIQKTGYIIEAGWCLVVQTSVKGKDVIMVFLKSTNQASRITDARTINRWIIATH